MKKVIVCLCIFGLMVAVFLAPAFAAESINEYTGENSFNFALAVDGDFAVVVHENYADVDNFSFAIANSGLNMVSGPGGSNSVGTGNAMAGTQTGTIANSNISIVEFDHIGPFLLDGGTVARNSHTGKKSNNTALAFDIDLAVVFNENKADIDNFSVAIANSGFNIVSGAGGNNSIDTGDANASTETFTLANTNWSEVTVGGSDGSASAINKYTGEKSHNSALAVAINAGVVVNENKADVDNFSLAVANTGVNSASGAGGSNSVSTGNASATTETCTVANTNISSVSVDGGASSEASNSYTGKDSKNTAVGVDVNAAVVVNDNESKVENNSIAVANTGVNSASGAGGSNSVSTGNASATTGTGTVTNTNVTTINGDGGGFPPIPFP